MVNSYVITTFLRLLSVTLILFFLQIGDNRHAFAQTIELDELFDDLQSEKSPKSQLAVDKIWKEWRKSGSDSIDFLLERGMGAMQNGRLIEAIEHFTAAIDHAPEFAEAWNMRATAFYLMEEFGLSVADIERTLILNPRHFGAMAGLAMILERSEKYEAALEVYNRVIDVHPHSQEANEAIKRLTQELQGTSL